MQLLGALKALLPQESPEAGFAGLAGLDQAQREFLAQGTGVGRWASQRVCVHDMEWR